MGSPMKRLGERACGGRGPLAAQVPLDGGRQRRDRLRRDAVQRRRAQRVVGMDALVAEADDLAPRLGDGGAGLLRRLLGGLPDERWVRR